MREDKQKIIFCDHDFGFSDSPKEDYEQVDKEKLFCKNCKEHFLVIINAYKEKIDDMSDNFKECGKTMFLMADFYETMKIAFEKRNNKK